MFLVYWAEKSANISQISSIGLGCATVSIFDRFRTPAWRPYRAAMFVSMGLSALFPLLHGVKMYGIQDMRQRVGLSWTVLQGILYILGAGIYAVSRASQCLKGILMISGALARTKLSWIVRYLGQFSPDFPYPRRPCCSFTSLWSFESIRLPSFYVGFRLLIYDNKHPPMGENTIDLDFWFAMNCMARNWQTMSMDRLLLLMVHGRPFHFCLGLRLVTQIRGTKVIINSPTHHITTPLLLTIS